jgi:hypothetical protein
MDQEFEPKVIESISEEQLERLRKEARDKALTSRHRWRQRGSYVVCQSCDYEHGFYIERGKLLQGVDENGHPIFMDEVVR